MSETQMVSVAAAQGGESESGTALSTKLSAEQKAAKREEAKMKSRITLSTYTNAAFTAQAFSVQEGANLSELQAQLREQCLKVKNGNIGRAESMLISQAHSLDVIFTRLALDASVNLQSNVPAAETYLRLALKAQAQCRATLETLATIKNPPVVFARQANIANGPQQVNNGTRQNSERGEDGVSEPVRAGARPRGIETQQSGLLENTNGQRLDTGATRPAIGSNQAVATVAIINRPPNRPKEKPRRGLTAGRVEHGQPCARWPGPCASAGRASHRDGGRPGTDGNYCAKQKRISSGPKRTWISRRSDFSESLKSRASRIERSFVGRWRIDSDHPSKGDFSHVVRSRVAVDWDWDRRNPVGASVLYPHLLDTRHRLAMA